jgi:hypothetical protein
MHRGVAVCASLSCETASATGLAPHGAKYFFECVKTLAMTGRRGGDVRGRPMFIGSKRIVRYKTFSLIHVFFAQTLYWRWFDASRGALFS